jgi:hypothetical protein
MGDESTSQRVEQREQSPVVLRSVWPSIPALAWRPHRARRQGGKWRACACRDLTGLVLSFASTTRRRPPVRQSATSSVRPSTFLCLLAWTATVSLATGPLSDLLRTLPSRQLLQQWYDTSPNTSSPNMRLSASRRVHPPPSPQALSRAHTKPLARSRSLSLPFCITPPAPETATHGLDFPHKLPWLNPFHAIDCDPLRPPRTCHIASANRPARATCMPSSCHFHATHVSLPIRFSSFPFPFPSNHTTACPTGLPGSPRVKCRSSRTCFGKSPLAHTAPTVCPARQSALRP